MQLSVGDRVRWTTKDGLVVEGTVALYLPVGEPIPDAYYERPRGVTEFTKVRRFRPTQRVARRDNRYIVDCGIQQVATDYHGRPVYDTVYHILPEWAEWRIL